mmetsp:Transcript_90840/g.252898  ORF Transcript_90840/g.252898 Transcript_90840/m.252898 type:complete len:136 (+) Transcript_90840:95-502(+)
MSGWCFHGWPDAFAVPVSDGELCIVKNTFITLVNVSDLTTPFRRCHSEGSVCTLTSAAPMRLDAIKDGTPGPTEPCAEGLSRTRRCRPPKSVRMRCKEIAQDNAEDAAAVNALPGNGRRYLQRLLRAPVGETEDA